MTTVKQFAKGIEHLLLIGAINQLVLRCDRQSEFVKRLELAMSRVN